MIPRLHDSMIPRFQDSMIPRFQIQDSMFYSLPISSLLWAADLVISFIGRKLGYTQTL